MSFPPPDRRVPPPGPTPASPSAAPPAGPSSGQLLLTARSQSAEASGLAVDAPAGPVLTCAAKDSTPASLWFCDLQSATLQIAEKALPVPGTPNAGSGQTHVFVLTAPRRREPVQPTVWHPYVADLADHDLVIEALSDPQLSEQSYDLSTGNWTTADANDLAPLFARLTSVNVDQHPGPIIGHPHQTISGGLGESDLGRAIGGAVYAASPETTGGEWLALWPFAAERARRYTFKAESCGVSRGDRAVEHLAFRLVILPREEWTIGIGLPGAPGSGGWSKKKVGDLARKPGGDRLVADEIKVRRYDADGARTEVKTRKNSRKLGYKETIVAETTEAVGLIQMRTSPVAEKGRLSKEDSQPKTRLLPLTFTYRAAGQERTFKFDDGFKDDLESVASGASAAMPKNARAAMRKARQLARRLSQIKTLSDEIGKLFSLGSVGWQVKYEWDWFRSELQLHFGTRWPAAYAEQHRVHYVERFFGVGGECSLIAGSVEGLVGLDFDKLGFKLFAKLYVKVSFDAKLGGHGSIAYTNPQDIRPAALRFDAKGALKFDVDAGVTAGANAYGASLRARAALTYELKGDINGYFSADGNHRLVANASGGPMQLVAEVEKPWGSVRTYQIEPRTLFDEATLCDNKSLL